MHTPLHDLDARVEVYTLMNAQIISCDDLCELELGRKNPLTLKKLSPRSLSPMTPRTGKCGPALLTVPLTAVIHSYS